MQKLHTKETPWPRPPRNRNWTSRNVSNTKRSSASFIEATIRRC
ncbi:hypothetical protein DSM3645_02558 [Blastopirellula marina DSM 3645]|uniref:Uncharacterized protein n=1 Tax=Blastopirellula marina DSM 3645 TaxID=314230 RepID=A3ZVH5_9BACT|nr:hypothetical protein DSM3645_02558 [Blastopirellula marina DSM 3645]